jgi:GntR family transcriptional regulator
MSVVDSLYEALQPHGNRPVRALQHLRAVALDEETSRLLQLPTGSPGLLIERRAFLADGRVVESTRSFYRGDAYDFVAELHSE